MATIRVRSTDGNNVDNGSTWSLSKLDLVGAANVDAAGDTIYVSDNHNESTSTASITWFFGGTNASPTNVLCVDDAADPPTALATTAQVTTTSTGSITILGNVNFYGHTLNVGSGAVNSNLTLSAAIDLIQNYAACTFNIIGTGSTSGINIGTSGNSNPTLIQWNNVNVSFGNASASIKFGLGELIWNGGGVSSGSTALTGAIITPNVIGRYMRARVSGVDLQHMGSAANLTSAGGGTLDVLFSNIRLPASWTGSLVTGTMGVRDRVEMHNGDNADTSYRLWIESYAGSVKSETTITRTGGATDGVAGFSWKLTTSANAKYPHMALHTCSLPALWNTVVGSAVTVTVHLVTDNVTLTDEDAWLEVEYLGVSGFPQTAFVDDAKIQLATAANQTTSTETWTTTGLTTPVKQELSVTFTPQEAGYVKAVVYLAKASTTAYLCPKLVQS